MRHWLLAITLLLVSVALMEAAAWAVHRFIMHGWGWGWHRSHHSPRERLFERNDLYGAIFAAISMGLFLVLPLIWPPLWWAAAGTLVYGLLYTLLHDGMVHRRLPWLRAPRRGYLKRLVQAHRLHHAIRERDGAVSFGFLYAPPVARLRGALRGERKA
jgi:beta-carotene 3-hydroxylase